MKLTDIIMRAMARTEPPSEVTCLTNWDTTKMSANTEHDQPLGFLRPVLVALWIPERLPICTPSLLDFLGCAMTNEDGLSTPFDDHVFAQWDAGKLDFSLCERKDIGGGSHRLKEAGDGRLGDGGGEDAQRTDHKVRHGTVGFIRLGAVCGEVRDLGSVFCNGRGVKKTGLIERRCSRCCFFVFLVGISLGRCLLLERAYKRRSWRRGPQMSTLHHQ